MKTKIPPKTARERRLEDVIDAMEDVLSWYTDEHERSSREDYEMPDDLLDYERKLEEAQQNLVELDAPDQLSAKRKR